MTTRYCLFICFTPLQCVIACQLILRNKLKAHLLYVADVDSGKSRHYFDSVASICEAAQYLVLSRLSWVNFCRLRKCVKQRPSYQAVYLASIDNIYFHYILSYLSFSDLYTFDDGVANINVGGEYWRGSNYGWFKRAALWLLGGKYNILRVKAESKGHYTIYNAPNALGPEVEKIDLFSSVSAIESDDRSPIKVFLGQPLFEDDAVRSHKLVSEAVAYVKPDYYFPHPREVFHVEGIEYIESNLIVEDYVLHMLTSGQWAEVEIYSYCSSALFNLHGARRVRCTPIMHPDFQLPSLYTLMTKVGMKCLYLRGR